MPPQLHHAISGVLCPMRARGLDGVTGWQRSCRSAGQRIFERLIPLKAVAPVRIRSGLPTSTTTTRPLTCTNKGQRPWYVPDRIRSGPAEGGGCTRYVPSTVAASAWPARRRRGEDRGGRCGRRWRFRQTLVAAGALEGVDLELWLLVGGGQAGVAE
jgi:hypothetical protein